MGVKLDVIEPESAPWYAGGLRFTCTQCGNCCTGGPGYVWVTEQEIERLAAHLQLPVRLFLRQYCRKVGRRISLKERRQPNGDHDCIFLSERPAVGRGGASGNELAEGERIPMAGRSCAVYPVRPLQCRTWPFWRENLESPGAWKHAGRRCHGMDFGSRVFDRERIEGIRDADAWPENPPTSAAKPDEAI